MAGCCIVRVVFVLLGAVLGVSGSGGPVLSVTEPPPNAVWLDSLGVAGVSQDWGRATQAGGSVEGRPLRDRLARPTPTAWGPTPRAR